MELISFIVRFSVLFVKTAQKVDPTLSFKTHPATHCSLFLNVYCSSLCFHFKKNMTQALENLYF